MNAQQFTPIIANIMYVGPLFGNQVWNDSGFDIMEDNSLIVFIMFYICLNALQYDNTLFLFTFFHV